MSLKGTLKAKATSWAGQLTKLAKSYAPNHIRPAISSHIEEKGEGTFIIRITADRYQPLEPRRTIPNDARAQEYGSGLRARRGVKKKYLILPKTKNVLAFHWEVADRESEHFVFLPDGRVSLAFVRHPGIEAANAGKGYIAPAVNELRKRGRKELSQAVREAILDDIRRSFGRT